jgi:hypothetical protein
MTHVNNTLPLLHRPTVEDALSTKLHLRDPSFGGVVLLVCALGARHVDDPRVWPPGGSKRSAGWHWFTQVDIARRDLFRPPRLYDVQTYILAAWYGSLLFRGNLVWVLLGISIRMIQQVGAHRRKIYKATPNAHDELWKRCFWYGSSIEIRTITLIAFFRISLIFDVSMSSETGRPCAWSENEYVLCMIHWSTHHLTDAIFRFDTDLPIDCDDEYWECDGSDHPFQQPAGKPSHIAYLVHYIKLKLVHLRAMRRLVRSDCTLVEVAIYS